MTRKIAMWAGTAVTGLCGIVLLGGGKIHSGTLLIVTAFVAVILVGRTRPPVWVRVVLLCAIYGAVIANISTTELPSSSDTKVIASSENVAPPSTGYRFLDQLIYISNNFLTQAAPS
ncbi:hypothetical protein [Promicromonospora sp. NPDC059942]|uniref:hypothetical protein n=1 Tax=Promicromonospora sp. NPDC059942 TaxID=3347009 RepID=UPI0036552622